MEKLRLLVNVVSTTGIKGRAARKVVIAIGGIKFLLLNNRGDFHSYSNIP